MAAHSDCRAKAANTDDAGRIAATPYGAAVSVVLADLERMVCELKSERVRAGGVPVTSLLKCIHDAARGLRTELSLAVDSPWGRQLAALRGEIASLLKAQIEAAPECVRRLLRHRTASEIAAGSVLDPGDVAKAEALIDLVGSCRNYAGELAISEMTTRCYHDLEH